MAKTRARSGEASAGDGQPKRARKSGTGAATGDGKPRRGPRQKLREEAASHALAARDTTLPVPPPEIATLAELIATDGGAVLAVFREPLAGQPLVLATLPIDRVEPTPYQRSASSAHVDRLADAIARTGLYLDPIIAFRGRVAGDGELTWHTPNGGHRLAAMRKMGAKAITALVVPDDKIAWRILALNTEKAHNLRERALEVARMAHGLAPLGGRESDYAPYFEEPALLTIGLAYEKNGRLAGGAWHPILKRLETWSEAPIAEAMGLRERHAEELLALDEKVGEIVEALKARGLQSPYLRNFVVARLNPLRFVPRGKAKPDEPARPVDWDRTFEKMRGAAERFDVERVHAGDLAHSGGAPDEADGA